MRNVFRNWWGRAVLFCLTFVGMLLTVPTSGYAQVARTEIIPFSSTTLTDQEFLTGHKGGRPTSLAGELRLTQAGLERQPVVVLLHGSGGISSYVTDWVQDLNSMGVATFVVDSFAGRGISNTLYDQTQLGRFAMIVDAYQALDLLAKDPRIDPHRIALMGFSRGGQSALYASLKRFQGMYGLADQEFAAYIPFYAACNTAVKDDEDVSDKPIRMFHGGADNFNAAAPCRAYAERLKAHGKDVQFTEYAGAYHVFDGKAYKKPVILAKAPSTAHCDLAEGTDGAIINGKTKAPFAYTDACVEHGPTLAYDEKASTEVRQAVKDFLSMSLKLQQK